MTSTAAKTKLSSEQYEDSVIQINAQRFYVRSSSRPSSLREVRIREDNSMVCSCPSRRPCIHIAVVKTFIEKSLTPVECPCRGCKTGSSLGCYRNLQESDWQWISQMGA